MVKKSKIREDFEEVFKSGNQTIIKQYLEKYPWLLSEISNEMDETMTIQHQIIAALGIMEDELSGAVTVLEINDCLKDDFKKKYTEDQLNRILQDVENLNLVKKESKGYILTSEGGRICDAFLNANLEEFEG
jgi:hypothetical protein